MKKSIDISPLIFPMPAVLVGTYCLDGTADAMTASWTAACCHTPPCVGVAVRSNRKTYENITEKKQFTINIPTAEMETQVDFLGIVSKKTTPNKLEIAALTTRPGTATDAPIIVECPINVECNLFKSLEIGTHTWFVGEVVHVHADTSVLDESGNILGEKVNPLAYTPSVRRYARMGPLLNQAFDVGKQLKNT